MVGAAQTEKQLLDAMPNGRMSPAQIQSSLDRIKRLSDQMPERQKLDLLRKLGFQPGPTLKDPKTVDLIKRLQDAAGLSPSGEMDPWTLMALAAANKSRDTSIAHGVPPQAPVSYAQRRPSGGAPAGAPSAPGRAPVGKLRDNQQEAYKAAIDAGLNPTAAKALVANMTAESLSRPNDNHWDVHHMSQGICQWDPQRSARIAAHFGKEPKDMTVAEQTKAAIWEMQNYYPKTASALQSGDAGTAMNALVRDFERPADPDGQVRNRLAGMANVSYLDSAAAR